MSTRPSIQIRIPTHLAAGLKEAVKPVARRESVAFALVSHTNTDRGTVVLVRKIMSLPADAYLATSAHGAKWRGGSMLPILNEAISANLGIVLFHVHQPDGVVELSDDDRRSASELLPVFQNLIPGRPHGSAVFSRDDIAGLMLLPNADEIREQVSMRWVGKVLRDVPNRVAGGQQDFDQEVYDRQMLLIGGKGQVLLKATTIGVVGLGGGGSHAVQQLAHLGAGKIIGVDGDRAAKSNRHRLIGMQWLDAVVRRFKTKIMARMVKRINRSVQFEGIPYPIPDRRAIDVLKQADIIIGCVDTLHARADLQSFAWRYLIPYIDVGLLIVPASETHPEVSVGGNIATFVPGGYCGWCIGLISKQKLDAETGGRPRSYLQGGAAQAQVVSLNGLLASQAVSEALQLITGFAPSDREDSFKKFDGVEGTLTKWIVKRNAKCPECQNVLGAGDIIWQKS
jgi:molybdopterin-synthase adenylyltransferase